MSYKENPKTSGSGIICCIPQNTKCPVGCEDCFFQSGRSYLEPLDQNLPNMPEENLYQIVRVNDGNDSNVDRDKVIQATKIYKNKFYNTSIPKDLGDFDAPVVLTLNPAKMTDKSIHNLAKIPENLMFVRIRTNTWNLELVDLAVLIYAQKGIPVVLTFMAYYDENSIPEDHRKNYMYRKRTLNSYWAITTDAWREVMKRYENELQVYSCGKIEGEKGKTSCKYCGNCLREYYSTKERMIS